MQDLLVPIIVGVIVLTIERGLELFLKIKKISCSDCCRVEMFPERSKDKDKDKDKGFP